MLKHSSVCGRSTLDTRCKQQTQDTHSAPCCLGMQPNCGLWEGPGIYSETTVAYSMLMVIHHFITPRSLCSKLQVSTMDVLAVTFDLSVWAFLHHLQMWCCQGQSAMDFSLIFRWLEILFGVSCLLKSHVLSSVNCWPLSKSTLFQISCVIPALCRFHLNYLCNCGLQHWWSKAVMLFYKSCSCGSPSYISLI